MKVFRITSKFAYKSSTIKKQYYEIKDWKEAGLKKPSWIDIGEAISFDLKDLNPKRIGTLTTKDIKSLAVFIQNYEY